MSNFGLVSQLLAAKKRSLWRQWVPDKWRYWHGPRFSGEIVGILPDQAVQGWAWQIPEGSAEVWDAPKTTKLWERLTEEIAERKVKVIGLDPGTEFVPPESVLGTPGFPGVSDGKTLELLLFIKRFRRLIRNYDITPQKAKAMILWEEGNLGVACARLLARELRFLVLVSPNTRLLERTGELVAYETGISPQIYTTPPADFKGAKIVVKCGPTPNLKLPRCANRVIRCELFQTYPSLNSINVEHTITVKHRNALVPVYPALGEAILRSYFEMNLGFWYGADLPLERVFKLAMLLREIGFDVSI